MITYSGSEWGRGDGVNNTPPIRPRPFARMPKEELRVVLTKAQYKDNIHESINSPSPNLWIECKKSTIQYGYYHITICTMLSLDSHHIVDLYCWVDELVEKPVDKKTGRPLSLSTEEVLTLLVWNALVLRQKTLKDLHRFVSMY
jgi:hypothetical protein